VRWRLSSAGVERLEQLRAGGGFTMSVGVRYGLLGGTGAPDWREPHRPGRVPYPDQPVQVIIKAHDWAQNVLEPMQQAAAVSLVVALHDSAASHPDERLRDIAWNRENAVLALGTAASLAQLIFTEQ
jgi:hypothetical protein